MSDCALCSHAAALFAVTSAFSLWLPHRYSDVLAPDGRHGFYVEDRYNPTKPSQRLYASLGEFVVDYQLRGELANWVSNVAVDSK